MKQKCIRALCLSIVFLFSISNVLAQAGGSHVVTTRKAATTKVKKTTDLHRFKEENIYKGWHNTIRLQYEPLVVPGVHYQGHYRFNKVFELGVGLGYECVFHPLGYYYDYFCHNVPLYANARFIIKGNKKVNPFFGISTGINISFYKIALHYLTGFGDGEYWSAAGLYLDQVRVASFEEPLELIVGQAMSVGFLARFEVGCDFRVTSKNSVGISLGIKNAVHKRVNERFFDLRPFVSIGYTF